MSTVIIAFFSQCLKITEKVSLIIAREASYTYNFEWTKVPKTVNLTSF